MIEFTIVNDVYQTISNPRFITPPNTKLIHLATAKRRNKEYTAVLIQGPQDQKCYLMEVDDSSPEFFKTIEDENEYNEFFMFLLEQGFLGFAIDREISLGEKGLG